jgi:ankyrin repeat protein
MAAPRAKKHKASEEESSESEGRTKTKIARTTNSNHESSSRRSSRRRSRSRSIDAVIIGADPWARVAATGNNTINGTINGNGNDNGAASFVTAGRGSLSGWTHCLLCGIYSKKKHALGRGIANHLKDVHTPWNPGKLAQKIHRRQHERRERELYQRSSKKRRRRPVEEENGGNTDNNNNNETMAFDSDDRTTTASEAFKPLASWMPTEEEKKAWGAKILEVLQIIEEERMTLSSAASKTTTNVRDLEPKENENASRTGSKDESSEMKQKPQNEDKTGKVVIAYRDSLPPFLMAASKGDLKKLQELVEEAKQKDGGKPGTLSASSKTRGTIQNDDNGEKIHKKHHHLRTLLLNTRDRHKSTADHWAAGGGHLDCLRYLYNLRATLLGVSDNRNTGVKPRQTQQDLESTSGCGDGSNNSSSKRKNNKTRRRDGKTCLHYAARNGHVRCIRYLLELGCSSDQPATHKHTQAQAYENLHNFHTTHTVDERSGEGTTPLHLACYGGHPRAVKILVGDYGADPKAANDWGCTCAHWAAMTLSDLEPSVRDLCGYLSETCGVSFTETQGQGHTALHKAAHKRNNHVIRWMAEDSNTNGGAGLEPNEKEKAGAPDLGGHKPSDIWRNMGGDAAFAEWMKTVMGW